MGKVEKVIVLSVLFLIALILVVSLTVDDPLNKAGVVEAGAPPPPSNTTPVVPAPTGELASAKRGMDASGLLSSEITPQADPVAVKPAPGGNAAAAVPAPTPVASDAAAAPLAVIPSPVLPAGALLKKLDGLQDSILPDMKLYTWKEGDSYRSIAHNYYGNWQKLTVLKRSNEGRTDVKPGQQIFVPVFDTDAALLAAERPKDGTAERLGASAPKNSGSGSRIHVVKDGESLWKIAKSELGNGDRWKEIYELNKDVLAKPEAVHKGQRLRIP